jgi:glutamate--cysteine ligase
MSRDTLLRHDTIDNLQTLTAYFASGSKPSSDRAVGMEHEKFGFSSSHLPLPYTDGIQAIMQRLSADYGWAPVLDAGHLTALERDGAAITLEPGGQFELSGAPFARLDDTARELASHLQETLAVSAPLGVRWLLIGSQPFHSLDAIPWMPKSRYAIMSRYLPTRGSLAAHMMKMTCTVQANFDYTSEADAAQMLRAILSVTSIASALFASSPFYLSSPFSMINRRCHIWTDTDPDRCGFVEAMLQPGFSFSDYVEYLLNIPMICIRRDQGYLDATGRTFRQFLDDGLSVGGVTHRATIGDWEMHLSMVWPEVRMKRYIEVRGCDVVPPDLMLSMVALWKGILYDPDARAASIALTDHLSYTDRIAFHADMIRVGLQSLTPDGTPMLGLARSLVQLASDGLDRQYPGESRYLQPLIEQVVTPGASLASQMMSAYAANPTPAGLDAALAPYWLDAAAPIAR